MLKRLFSYYRNYKIYAILSPVMMLCEVIADVAIPMLIPPAGYTTTQEPFKSLITMGDEMVASGKIKDYSVFAVQPWLDIEEIDSRVIAIGEDVEVRISAAGMGDTTSEPTGIIALYNALECKASLTMYQNRSHTYNPPISVKVSVSK